MNDSNQAQEDPEQGLIDLFDARVPGGKEGIA